MEKSTIQKMIEDGILTEKDIEEYYNSNIKPQKEVKSNIKLQEVKSNSEKTIYSTIEDGVLVKFDERDLNSEGEYIPPKDVTIIGDGVFANCDKLIKIALHKGITEIKQYAFWACCNLESIAMTNNVKLIGHNAFANCVNLKDIKLSSNIETLEPGTFAACTNLQQIELPENVKRIRDYVFMYCNELTSINLPQNLEYVSDLAFSSTPIESDVKRKVEGLLGPRKKVYSPLAAAIFD